MSKMKKIFMKLLGAVIVTVAITVAHIVVMPEGYPLWRGVAGWVMIWLSVDFYAYCRYKY